MAAAERPSTRPSHLVDARVVKALGHPTRVRILQTLRRRELVSPVELASELGVALGTVGYHVHRLEELGFIELATRTPRRGAVEHHYRARPALDLLGDAVVAPAGEGPAAAAIELVGTAHDALARGGFDDLAALAERRELTLDARGRARLDDELDRLRAAIERIGQASAGRLAVANGEGRPRPATVVLVLFDAPELPPDEPAAA
jgi:DNA-binding transcriptional ArsR family regulator